MSAENQSLRIASAMIHVARQVLDEIDGSPVLKEGNLLAGFALAILLIETALYPQFSASLARVMSDPDHLREVQSWVKRARAKAAH